MIHRITGIAVTSLALAFGISVFSPVETSAANAQEKDKKKEKNPLEGKKGTYVGTLVSKDKNSIEVKAPGDEKSRRFLPHWKGGAPSAGGGLDKEMLKNFDAIKIGSRVEVEWVYEERFRAEKVTVLKTPAKDKDK
ncbi:MAG: hypothetical protein EXS16_21030 [Gemmataceae bacterium]|nr:hypothetical protein [Gemmataceae bacterium]